MTNRRGKYGSSHRFPILGWWLHEIRRQLILGRKAIINLDSVLNSKDITLLMKFCIVKAMVFPVVRCRCESWTIKKAECRRFDTFKLWCWTRVLSVSSTARSSNQCILKEINPEYSLEGLMLKLKLQYLGQLMWRADSLRKILIVGKDWRQEEKWAGEDEMVRQHYRFSGHESEHIPGDGEGQGSLACCSLWGCKESDTIWWLNNNT